VEVTGEGGVGIDDLFGEDARGRARQVVCEWKGSVGLEVGEERTRRTQVDLDGKQLKRERLNAGDDALETARGTEEKEEKISILCGSTTSRLCSEEIHT
jgi:hypothetical protein